MSEPDISALDAALAATLPPGSIYAVGGRVRDEVRAGLDRVARPAKDLDYVAVGLAIDDLVERLGRIGKTDVVGAAFAVVKCTIGGVTVDVALPRRERSTGAGHRDFVVEAGPEVPIDDDLARRDFRMNMLARRLADGRLIDPHGGEADIRARRIDLLRPEAFEEDPLRMLRAAQFAARFEYEVTPRTLEAMRGAAPLAETISPERVRDELVKLLGAARPSIGFEVMREGEVLPHVFPEIAEGIGVKQNEYHRYDVYEHTLKTLDAAPEGDLVVRLAALLHDVAKPRTKDGGHFYGHESLGAELTRSILSRRRFSNEIVERVAGLVRNHMFSADPSITPAAKRRFVRRVGVENLAEQFALRQADIVGSGLPKRDDSNERFEVEVRRLLAEKPPLSVKDLAVDGSDVIAAAVAAGILPEGSRGGLVVGSVLRALLDRVIEDPKLNDREALLAILPSAIRTWSEECSPGNKR
jgi:putative nucleotidyltransferase with HDIG domain